MTVRKSLFITVFIFLLSGIVPGIFNPSQLPAFLITPAIAKEVVFQEGQAIEDLYKAYEIWASQGIRFVVRDKDGNLITWGIGRLESWQGTRTVVAVRNAKGQFLTWANGKIETWQDKKTRYVFRTSKGHFVQWAYLDMTSRASFSANLTRLINISPASSSHFQLLVEIIYETIISDLKLSRTEKAFQFLATALKYAHQEANRGKLYLVARPVLEYLKRASLENPTDASLKTLVNDYSELCSMLR